jgi:hypothetical protein
MKGMGKVSNAALVASSNHAAHQHMHDSIGGRHEELSRQYDKGSRQHEFHDSISRSHYYASDSHFMGQQRTVASAAEPISSHLTRTSSTGLHGKPVMGNRSGIYN